MKRCLKMFRFEETEDFDRHIKDSIPNYEFISNIARVYTEIYSRENTSVYDLGCTTGRFLSEIELTEKVRKIGVDIIDHPSRRKGFEFQNKSIHEIEYDNPSVIISMFTLQFIDSITRDKIITQISNNLIEGGLFINCEKCYMNESIDQEIIGNAYYDFKLKSFNDNEIIKKSIELRSSMKIKRILEVENELLKIGHPRLIYRGYFFNIWVTEKNSITE